MTDVKITGYPSLIAFKPITKEAKEWVAEHIPDDASWLGDAFYVEHRYAENIAVGMVEAGLEVE